MTTELIVAIILAVGGWVCAIWQFSVNRRWQKKDKLSDRRYEAYKSFMKKLDAVNESMRKNPNFIFGEMESFLQVILRGSSEDSNTALERFLQSQFDMVKESTMPLLIITQEINELTLIASEELMVKLSELKKIVDDFYNETINCLSLISAKDPKSFKTLETIGHENRMLEYKDLYKEIVRMMRKEINVN